MATDSAYSAKQAIEDLLQENLLHSVLVPGPKGMVCINAQDAGSQNIDGYFKGAGLDSRNLSTKSLFVALAGQMVNGRDYVPGVFTMGHWVLTSSLQSGEVDPLAGIPAIEGSGAFLCPDPELALAHLAACWRRRLPIKIVAITGTNGKTTTKDFARAMLSAAGETQATPGNLNNQLGLPLTLLNLKHESRYAVIEMGASAIGDIKFLAHIAAPDVGVITNAAPAHLAKFGSLDNIIQGKGELLDALQTVGAAVLNADSPGFEQWSARARCPVISWGFRAGDHLWKWEKSDSNSNGNLILDGQSWPLPMPGRHNAANCCAAILACRALGIGDQSISQGLSNFQASDHRGKILPWNKRLVLDDSYNANPASMVAAVKSLSDISNQGRNIALLGAMAELGPQSEEIHFKTGQDLTKSNLNILLAVGENSFALADGFSELGEGLGIKVSDHQEATDWLKTHSLPGDKILIKGSRSSAMEIVIKKLDIL